MSELAKNEALVRRLIEKVWNTGDYSQLEALASPGYADSTRELNRNMRIAFPDLRGNKPFFPKGVYKFRSFEEKEAWEWKMRTR